MGMKVEIVNTDCDLPTTVYWIATVIRLAGTFARVTTQIYISTVKTATEKCVVALRGFAKLKKIQNKLDRAHPTHPPSTQTSFFYKPITDMDRTLKS